LVVNPAEIPIVSVVQALVNELREQILSGKVVQGNSLRENELCAAFNVSRHTVRSAVQALSYERLVRHEPNRGAFVAKVTEQDVKEIFRIRTLLELEAARSIAGNAMALSFARRALAKLRNLPDGVYWGDIRDADLGFHQALVEGLGSARINLIFAGLRTELRLCFLQIQEELSDKAMIVRQHREILQQLEAGNAKKALELVRHHLEDGCRNICAGIATRRAPGLAATPERSHREVAKSVAESVSRRKAKNRRPDTPA
jgi:DNA-binding GntR family transcriptional regulator